MFYVDSMLVAKQLSCEWRCNSAHLKPLYEEALEALFALRRQAGVMSVDVKHIYREFNADADGICNRVLDLSLAGAPPDSQGRHVCMNWDNFSEG